MGLTSEQITIIKATAPVVAQHSLEITKAFYPHMFENNPEVFQYFNKSNQASGRQPKALADAVVAYATHIDNLGVLSEAVERMVQKHVALLVPAEGYAIVGKNLMWAIHHVLGEAITEEIHDAWLAAYQQLANILISAEANLYKQQETNDGGWKGYRSFLVSDVQTTESGMMRIKLVPKDGKKVTLPIAGQYVSLHFEPAEVSGFEGEQHLAPRHYSIFQFSDDSYTLCIRRVKGGCISNHIHSQIKVGSCIQVTPPVGQFVLDESSSDVVFIAGGIGFTPLRPMAAKAQSLGRHVTWIHTANSPCDFMFSEPVGDHIVQWNSNVKGHMNADAILEHVKDPHHSQFFMCGPPEMMQFTAQQLKNAGIPKENVHYELFGPHFDLFQ